MDIGLVMNERDGSDIVERCIVIREPIIRSPRFSVCCNASDGSCDADNLLRLGTIHWVDSSGSGDTSQAIIFNIAGLCGCI